LEKSLQLDRFHLGVCYYPEHWPESLWEDDMRRMREMGMSVIRIAEFAWSIFEPKEGKFSFDVFDRVMDLARKHGLLVILGTPTATPPAWLTQKYPEVLNVTQNGVTYHHGQRRHYNYNTKIYRHLSERIAEKMAQRYHAHPALLGWQIDNELNCEVNVFYSYADHAAFRDWLREKYGTLEKLNEAWGTVFWSQTYTDWEQVHLTRPTPSDSPNPHQALDEKRFISASAISYCRLQAEAIRKHDKTHFITTNGLFGHIDNHRMTDETLDFISYDSYPMFSLLWPDKGENPLLDRKVGANLSVTRSISANFCVMEQQSGPGGWTNRIEHPSPKPGQMRLWTYQSIAHGADMVLYFRWRTATVGTEIYWHGINDYHNRPNRRCAEVTQIGKELAAVGERLAGSRYKADVAIVRDYDNEWDGELDNWHGPYERQSVAAWYKALQRAHVPGDMLYLRPGITTLADLSRYRCLVYPHPTILTDETAALLKEYVAQGGNLVFGCRTGYKNEHGHCYLMRPFPGPVADLCGVTVEDFTRIGQWQHEPTIHWDGAEVSGTMTSGPFCDILHPESEETAVIATYGRDAGYFAGKPALVQNRWGEGYAFYFGGVFTDLTAHALIRHIDLPCPAATDTLKVPAPVEVAVREKESGESFVFLLNYSDAPQTVEVREARTNLLTGKSVLGVVMLAPYEVAVLE
jgi:beta-galactosidase